MNSFQYMNYTFRPHGNIIGKDNDTRFQRLSWTINEHEALLRTEDGYNYEEFYKKAEAENSAVDIYYVAAKDAYYVPAGGFMGRINVAEMKKYIRLV